MKMNEGQRHSLTQRVFAHLLTSEGQMPPSVPAKKSVQHSSRPAFRGCSLNPATDHSQRKNSAEGCGHKGSCLTFVNQKQNSEAPPPVNFRNKGECLPGKQHVGSC